MLPVSAAEIAARLRDADPEVRRAVIRALVPLRGSSSSQAGVVRGDEVLVGSRGKAAMMATERDHRMISNHDEPTLPASMRHPIPRTDTNMEAQTVTDDAAGIRRTADTIIAATTDVLNPSPDVSGCPENVACLTAPAVLRGYADAEHHFGEGVAQRLDYGTGTEYDAVCVCGASWGEDGCTERERLYAVAAEIEGDHQGDGGDRP